MTRPYATKNIEQASTIQAATKIAPAIFFDNTGLGTFSFPASPAVTAVVLAYESGILVDARTLLTTRNQLFKRIKGGAR